MLKRIPRMGPRYFDIGVNFSDAMFLGYYNHSSNQKHPGDLSKVIHRATQFNVDKMLITASTIEESRLHFDLCRQYPQTLFSTVGVHPCTVAQEFYKPESDDLVDDIDDKFHQLKSLVVEGVKENIVKAFGEIGLDYDRLHYASKSQQKSMFKRQLDLIASLNHLELPLFLHMRSCCDDFIDIISPYISQGTIKPGNGVVHSFTGSELELQKLLDLGFFIGLNGCSLKLEENLQVAAKVPRDKLMIETDAPWCEIRKSHEGYKYLESYPNAFYPKVSGIAEEGDNGKNPSISKNPPIKPDDFLPFPSIKKEHYQKHMTAVQTVRDKGDDVAGILDLDSPLIKSRNEPVFIGLVAQIYCKLHHIEGDEIQLFLLQVYNNSCELFKV